MGLRVLTGNELDGDCGATAMLDSTASSSVGSASSSSIGTGSSTTGADADCCWRLLWLGGRCCCCRRRLSSSSSVSCCFKRSFSRTCRSRLRRSSLRLRRVVSTLRLCSSAWSSLTLNECTQSTTSGGKLYDAFFFLAAGGFWC